MQASKKEMKTEAVERMKLLGMNPQAIEEFEKEGNLNLSRYGVLFPLEDEQWKRVRQFEKENGYCVYHVIQNFTNIGEMLSMLYVSTFKEEWEQDRIDIQEHIPMAYVANLDDEVCSEFGAIGVETIFGGLVRTA